MVFCTARIRTNFSVEILMMKNLIGIYARGLQKALAKAAGDHYEFLDETGTSTETLLKKYIDQDMPVVFWACINMRKEIPGPSGNFWIQENDFAGPQTNIVCCWWDMMKKSIILMIRMITME